MTKIEQKIKAVFKKAQQQGDVIGKKSMEDVLELGKPDSVNASAFCKALASQLTVMVKELDVNKKGLQKAIALLNKEAKKHAKNG